MLPNTDVSSIFSTHLWPLSETMPQSSRKCTFSHTACKGNQEGTVSLTLCQGQLFCFPKSNVFCLTNNGILLQ